MYRNECIVIWSKLLTAQNQMHNNTQNTEEIVSTINSRVLLSSIQSIHISTYHLGHPSPSLDHEPLWRPQRFLLLLFSMHCFVCRLSHWINRQQSDVTSRRQSRQLVKPRNYFNESKHTWNMHICPQWIILDYNNFSHVRRNNLYTYIFLL